MYVTGLIWSIGAALMYWLMESNIEASRLYRVYDPAIADRYALRATGSGAWMLFCAYNALPQLLR